jgi:CRP-like cAMP-binding protein
VIVRQGQAADGAYVLSAGTAQVVTALPGGGETEVAVLGPGGVFGEMALLEQGTRSASVIARGKVDAWFIDRDVFRLLLVQRESAAYLVRRRIIRTLCTRLRSLNSKTAAADAKFQATLSARGVTGTARRLRRKRCAFDWPSFLPLLAVFEGFSHEEIRALTATAKCYCIERGGELFAQDSRADRVYIVVRGALEIGRELGGRRQRIGILGPGRLCGVLALLEGDRHSMSAAARETSTVLEISPRAFSRLFEGNDGVAAKFQDAIIRELLRALARANNHLTRLISQQCIRGVRSGTQRAASLTRQRARIEIQSR